MSQASPSPCPGCCCWGLKMRVMRTLELTSTPKSTTQAQQRVLKFKDKVYFYKVVA
ncbi:GL24159 [Drosophila persimilis]|uniref:GL24159 n=1 Tax=Drosophila persimilis TaxID=7234 RepID=B4G452_DROPE|nr:GL24159 [Drosophila persimilis]